MCHMLRLLFCLSLLEAGVVRTAELWTNQAGQVIEARLESFDGVSLTLVRTNGAILKLPLSALVQNDQRRVLQQKGHSIAPEFVKAAYQDARTVVTRYDKLPAEQRSEEGRKKAVNMACAIFDARVSARATEITDKAALEEIARLRLQLGGAEQR